ncbi:MAG: hypothetical protein ACJAYB_002184 [Psychromonas sp.]
MTIGFLDDSQVDHMTNAIIDRHTGTGTHSKDQHRHNKAPEIDLFTLPKRKLIISQFFCLFHPIEQQHLISGINQ